MPYVNLTLTIVTVFFLILLTFITNPFETLIRVPADGQGLNPLLQNPGMIFHPPTLFLGYVGFTVPYAFAMAALITGQLGSAWIRSTRRWTLFAWFFLTLGNLLGAKWAYMELGWGGYWAWDPVENASFMPWLVATAYLHSVMVQEKRDMLKVWNIVLVTLTFLLTLFGTFITRSGLIASVHSFGRSSLGWIFLAFLGICAAASFNLLIRRLPQLKSHNELDSYLSRESSFLYNNVILMSITFATLWGTIFPVISEAVRGVKVTVGPPFFNTVNIPFGLALLALTGLCPLLAWRKTTFDNVRRNFLFPGLLSAAGGLLLWFLGIRLFYPLLSFTLALFVLLSITFEFSRGAAARKRSTGEPLAKALWMNVKKNKRRYGGYIVHVGIVFIFVGITGSAYKVETQVAVQQGESFSIKDYMLTYESLATYSTTNTDISAATVSVFKSDSKITVLTPEKNFHRKQSQPATEVAIYSSLKEDVYIVLAGIEDDIAVFKVLVTPLVIWLWIGGCVMAVGTLFAMLPNMEKRPRPVRHFSKEAALEEG
ncbi:MAG: heme lyase CcmF/NrfE family subunit [bacterium]|nr:heme lyase CcmF/NrfE family subunit [bacterium]